MIRRFAFLFALAPALLFAANSDEHVSGDAVVQEMNLARQNPQLYATFVEELRSHFNGRYYVLPGGTRVVTKEGTRALDDAIRFLRHARPMQPLAYSEGMSRGAADHCADQAPGGFSHTGRDGSNPGVRMSRYGAWGLIWGENIAYGKTSARDIVLALIIDDGLPARKHRKNIFNAKFNFCGAAYGPHARYGSVCTTDFAGAYAEGGEPSGAAGSLIVAKLR
jgi:uncharacterized protein YkwD